MENYKIATIDPAPYKLIGQLKYLVLILQPNKDALNSFIGFAGQTCPMCVQWFDGTQDFPKDVIQLPKLFDTKQEAEEAIKKGRAQ